jgi:hypothetical protein
MRKVWLAAVVGLALAFVGPASAQFPTGTTAAPSFFTGVNPRQITYTTIDTSKAFKQMNSQIIRPPTQQSAFSLSSIFHAIPMPSWPPRLGFSNPPPPKNPFPQTIIRTN